MKQGMQWVRSLLAKMFYNAWKRLAEKGQIDPFTLIGLEAYYFDMSGKKRVVGTITGYGDQGFAVTCSKDKKVFMDKPLYCFDSKTSTMVQIYHPKK